MFQNNYIHEIELNTSNLCGAKCIICSEPHGCDNDKIMKPEVFNILCKQLKDVKFDIIQTSGDGETFMNPHYLDYVRKLKKEFPNVPRWIYNNFSMMTKERADIICNENLFDRIHVRIDSLEKWIFEKASNLNMDSVFENLKYFLSINKTPFTILYNNIKDYYNRCKIVLGKRPVRDRFSDSELLQVKDEQNDIRNYFIKYMDKPDLLAMAKINHCLWGERYRDDVKFNPFYPCPKIKVIEKVCWVYPNGDIGMCCFEDRQSPAFKLGNIMENHILDIFYGEKRKRILKILNNLESENPFSEYPCRSPRLCNFGDGVENK